MKRSASFVLVLLLAACQSTPAPGASCVRGSDCGSPLVCRHGRCRVECVDARDCSVGLRCYVDASGVGACSLPPEVRCTSDTECGSDLVCAAGECRTTCAAMDACGPGGACVAGSCITPVNGTDAAVDPVDTGTTTQTDAATPRDAFVVLADGGRALSGTGSACTSGGADGGTCTGAYVCATENEDLSVPVCRLPCTEQPDCAGEGVGSFCGTRGHCTTACDPVDGRGCGGEACGLYTGNPAGMPMSDYTDCRPAGSAAEGQGCVIEHDCEAGTSCINGTCRRVCHVGLPQPAECTGGLECFPQAQVINGTHVVWGTCCDVMTGC